MSNRRVIRLLYCALLLPLLFAMFFLYKNSNSEALRRRYPSPYWTPNFLRNISHILLPSTTTLLMKPDCSDKTFLLIIVHSRIENAGARQRIRETWGNTTDFNYQHFASQHAQMRGRYLKPLPDRIEHYKDYIERNKRSDGTINLPVRVVFIVGRNANSSSQKFLHIEQQQYNDIVQQNFIDSYYNLTLKSVMMLKWVTQHCDTHKIAFLMKCDEDVFVNVPNLLHFLLGGTIPVYNSTLQLHDWRSVNVFAAINRLNSTEKVLAGHQKCSIYPEPDVNDKFYMPYAVFNERIYPPYLAGPSYIISSDVLPQLYEMALHTPLFHFEDLFLTGFCAKRLNLNRQHNPLFSYDRWAYYFNIDRICFLKGCIIQHWVSKDMPKMYKFVKSNDVKCTAPNKKYHEQALRINLCLD